MLANITSHDDFSGGFVFFRKRVVYGRYIADKDCARFIAVIVQVLVNVVLQQTNIEKKRVRMAIAAFCS